MNVAILGLKILTKGDLRSSHFCYLQMVSIYQDSSLDMGFVN